jgi:hypothetical protein
MSEGGPKNVEENSEEKDKYSGEMIGSSIYEIVGGSKEDKMEAGEYFQEGINEHSGKFFVSGDKTYQVESLECKKTGEELEMTRDILTKIEKFMKEMGGKPLKIKPEHIHFLDSEKVQAQNIPLENFFEPAHQYVAIYDSGNNLINAQAIAHEVLHFQSFASAEIGKDEQVRFRRLGFGIKVRGEEDFYFDKINEAVITELEKIFEEEYFDSVPGIQKELKNRQEFVDNFLRDHPDLPELANDVAYAFLNPNTGLVDGARYPYPKERDRLNQMIDYIYNENKDQFEERDQVLALFVGATMGGGMLDLARIIEKTYGKGSFRELGKMTKQSRQRVVDSE